VKKKGERLRVVLYARVSTDDQNVRQQLDFINVWCVKQGFVVVRWVCDEESGTLPLVVRKKFNRLLSDFSGFDGVVVYNLDRLTRNWDDVVFIERFFRDNWERCKLISTSDSVDLSNASGRMMFRIKMAVCCFMPEDMREKQRIGIDRARLEGKYVGGKKGRTWV
jgi:DNA invertase Pin-like site-specific DNA recombinase